MAKESNEVQLRKMNRTQLVEIIYLLQQNEQKLLAERNQLLTKLEERGIAIAEAGSIAEASLSLSGIFNDAQRAADEYLASVHQMNDLAHNANVKIVQAAEKQASAIMQDAQIKARKVLKQADAQAEQILLAAEEGAARATLAAQQQLQSSYAQADAILNKLSGLSGENAAVVHPVMPEFTVPNRQTVSHMFPHEEPAEFAPAPNMASQGQPPVASNAGAQPYEPAAPKKEYTIEFGAAPEQEMDFQAQQASMPESSVPESDLNEDVSTEGDAQPRSDNGVQGVSQSAMDLASELDIDPELASEIGAILALEEDLGDLEESAHDAPASQPMPDYDEMFNRAMEAEVRKEAKKAAKKAAKQAKKSAKRKSKEKRAEEEAKKSPAAMAAARNAEIVAKRNAVAKRKAEQEAKRKIEAERRARQAAEEKARQAERRTSGHDVQEVVPATIIENPMEQRSPWPPQQAQAQQSQQGAWAPRQHSRQPYQQCHPAYVQQQGAGYYQHGAPYQQPYVPQQEASQPTGLTPDSQIEVIPIGIPSILDSGDEAAGSASQAAIPRFKATW